MTSFDKEAWERAYKEAGDLPPEPVDFNDPNQTRDFLQKLVNEAGLKGQLMNGKEAMNFWKQQELNLENLILAELGDETVVRISDDKGRVVYEDIGANKYSWTGYMNLVIAYKRKGDLESVDKLMQIFPAHSQLEEELQEKLKEQPINRAFKGFDVVADKKLGRVSKVTRGHQYNLLPGSVDFRKFVANGSLDIDQMSDALFQAAASKEMTYSDDWDETDRTMQNVRKEFGDEIADKVWDKFVRKYQAEKGPAQS